MRTIRKRLLLALPTFLVLPASVALPAPLAAQELADLPGRLERRATSQRTIEGLSAAETRRLTEAADRAADILAQHPEVGTPPTGICLRMYTEFQGGVAGPRALAAAAFSIAVRYDASGCSNITSSGVRVELNEAAGFLHPDGTWATHMADDEGPIGVIPRIGTTRDGHDVLLLKGGRSVVLTRDGRSLFVPVTKERYLRWRIAEQERAITKVRSTRIEGADAYERWLREGKPQMIAGQEAALRAMQGRASAEEIARQRAANAKLLAGTEEVVRAMAAGLAGQDEQKAEVLEKADEVLRKLREALEDLSPAERREQACRSNYLLEEFGECTGRNGYYSLNPDYFSPSLPKSAIQVIVVSTPDGQHNMEITPYAQLRWRVFDELDYASLEALLR